jgi:hypothetical protein
MTEPLPINHTDFTPADIATTVNKHDEDFILVKERLNELERKFGNNEKIADTLCETAEKATKMHEMLAKTFLKLLQHDVPVKQEVSNLVNKTDRNYFYASVKRVGFLVATIVWSIIMIVIGAFVTHFFGGK